MSASMMKALDVEGRRILVRGTVQGVGFRPWVYRLAVEEGLSGRVRNDARGVTIEAFGRPEALEAFLRRLGTEAPPAALLREVREEPIPAEPLAGFAIVPSEGEGARRVSIPPDLATCPECLREVQDPADRRHLYPFTNCTHCGPRFTIARDVPYDRPATTMAGFAMCPACRREYEDPLDRRFHAQPVACPACGPRLRARERRRAARRATRPATRSGRPRAALARRGGSWRSRASAATTSRATPRRPRPSVRLLRERKKRDEKPFAVMVRDARRGARPRRDLDPAEEAPARLGRAPDRPRPAAARRRPRPRGRARQPPRRPDPGLHAAAPPPARGRGAAARHDLRQPLGGADGGG